MLFEVIKTAKVESLTNSTFLKPYTDATMFPHLSFDTPLQEGGKLVDYDETNVYLLARESYSSENTYRFMSVKHSDLTSTYQNVYIQGYEVSGMCQYNGKLDYFVGYHILSKEIRVWNLRESDTNCAIVSGVSNCTLSTFYWKSVPYTKEIEKHYIHSDCKHQGSTLKNSYTIGIGASSLDTLHPGQYNYFYAKFNTLYNLTETVIESYDELVSEKLVDVKVDMIHDLIYVILEINSNEYMGVKIYGPEDERTENNPNVALIAYNQNNADIRWVKIFGDLTYSDYYVGLEENRLVLNSYTTQFTENNEASKDIKIYEFRPESGYIDKNMTLGSPTDDEAFSIVNHMHSTYILAKINDNFFPHPNTGSVFGVDENETVFGMIWINGRFELVDIEGYNVSSLETLPIKAFPSIPTVYQPQFMFFSPASKIEVNGLYITNFDSYLGLYSTTDWNLTWNHCNRYTKQEDCISCDEYETQFLYKGIWYSSWEVQTYQYSDIVSNTARKHWKDCHFSCKSCLGSRKDQCMSWCTNGDWGTTLLDRDPNMGEWKWPTGSYESHGKWLKQWANGLYGRLESQWYEKWPPSTYSEIIYDSTSAENEYTHFEHNNDTDWIDYDNLLRFNISSKGIEIPGPTGLSSMLNEFTLSFWARADVLPTETYLINLFERVHIKIVSSRVRFLFEKSASTYIEPAYIGALNQIDTAKWVYISVSQREHKDAGIHQLEQRIVIATDRNEDAIEVGFKTDHTPETYHKFVNSIFLGGLSYSNPNSFTGYLKEVRLFNQFHGSPQMINDRLRVYQSHSFDDSHLIAYWKLSENYSETDQFQKIQDYSQHSLEESLAVSFSPITNPDYPFFIKSNSLGLKLWYYHDVATCKTVKNMPQVISRPWRLINLRNFNLLSSTHTIEVGDIIYINNGDCKTGTTKVIMTRTVNNDWNPDSDLNLESLEDGKHYYVWYKTLTKELEFNLGQFYLAKESRKIDPSDISAFVIIGLEIQLDVSQGDESYGDIIRFSKDCDTPQTTDYFVRRDSDYAYSPVVTNDFQKSYKYKMCHIPSYSDRINFFMDSLNNHEWVAAEIPQLGTNNLYTFEINYEPLDFKFETPFTEGDTLAFAWKRSTDLDCHTSNILSPSIEFLYGYFDLIWLGNDQGINGIDTDKEEIHLCWRSNSIGADTSYSRVGLITGHTYSFITQSYNVTASTSLPELSSIYPNYGSTEFYGTDAQIQFSFGGEYVFPAKRSGTQGKLGVYRGAIGYDGSIEVITSSILYEISTLDESNIPLLQQGNINCTASGVWNLTLSTATGTGMSPGEIYFLGLYPNSFASDVGNNYYLFGDNTNSGNAIYYHMFMSRSFNIIETPLNKVYGNTIVIEGVNIFEISGILARQSGSGITTGDWKTRSIKIRLSITGTTWTPSETPFASVYMENVNTTHITITNMDLKGCEDGNIFADFELVRGIKQGINEWSHERREYQKNVALGLIGCDPTWFKWSGPSDTDWTIWANYLTEYLVEGKWYSSCPTTHPTVNTTTLISNSVEYSIKNWVSDWGLGF